METDDLAIIISTMSEQSKYITLSLFIFFKTVSVFFLARHLEFHLFLVRMSHVCVCVCGLKIDDQIIVRKFSKLFFHFEQWIDYYISHGYNFMLYEQFCKQNQNQQYCSISIFIETKYNIKSLPRCRFQLYNGTKTDCVDINCDFFPIENRWAAEIFELGWFHSDTSQVV